MRRIRPSRLRQIVWNRLTKGPRWWELGYRFGTRHLIFNDDWILNLRGDISRERCIKLDIIESQLNNGFQCPTV